MEIFLGGEYVKLSEFLNWLFSNYIEIIGTLSGLIYLLYSVQGNKLLWPYGLLTSALYVVVFYSSGIYADMGINVYYVAISVYGWIYWSRLGKQNKEELAITRVSVKSILVLLLVTIVLFILIAFVLVEFTDSEIAYWDAFTTAASIVATWMLARKILEHWLIWIVVDAISTGLYIYKGLYPTVLLFLVYTVIAVVGYIQWKKQWRERKQNI